jgi:hypothetical protein
MKIISGGQTGVDRAALDAAIELGMDYGGAIPKGRMAEDGPIDAKYGKLVELESESYSARTEKNAADADATIVFTIDTPTEGTAYTVDCLKKHGKPYLLVNLKGTNDGEAIHMIGRWLDEAGPEILNIAGPRESKAPGIYERVRRILIKVM